MVYSYDNDADRQMEAGADGARQWWYVNFGNEANNFVSILIVDGVIDNVYLSDENGNNGLFEMEQVHLTAAEAVQKAEALGLRGGNPDEEETEWVSGFNFNLSWQSLAETPDEKRLFFEVIGISPDGNFAHVDFDAETGELLLAEEEICDEDGMTVEWRSFAE